MNTIDNNLRMRVKQIERYLLASGSASKFSLSILEENTSKEEYYCKLNAFYKYVKQTKR